MVEEKFNNVKSAAGSKIKNRIFDVIAVGVVLAAIAINLGALEWKEISSDTLIDLLAEFVPLLLTSILLTTNYYQKGVFYGKNSPAFSAIAESYSTLVTSLSGEEIDNMSEFCTEYNELALRKIQEPMLKKVAISYELYDSGNPHLDIKPLKILSKSKLSEMYDEHTVKVILKCNKIKIKGIKVNNLLGNENVDDISDLGKTENELRMKHNTFSAIKYTVSTAFMTLIAVKDILTWGWASVLLISFKLLFIFFRSYMSYFDGYNDITISLNNQLARKTDILKQFKYWFENKNKKLQNNLKISNNFKIS